MIDGAGKQGANDTAGATAASSDPEETKGGSHMPQTATRTDRRPTDGNASLQAHSYCHCRAWFLLQQQTAPD